MGTVRREFAPDLTRPTVNTSLDESLLMGDRNGTVADPQQVSAVVAGAHRRDSGVGGDEAAARGLADRLGEGTWWSRRTIISVESHERVEYAPVASNGRRRIPGDAIYSEPADLPDEAPGPAVASSLQSRCGFTSSPSADTRRRDDGGAILLAKQRVPPD
jgi:hypothetical protein